MRKYNRHIHVMVDQNTFDKIENICNENHLVKSEFVRLCVEYFIKNNKNNRIFNKDMKFRKQLIYEYRRFGNNLNQVAHKLNIALINDDITYTDKLDIKSAVKDIEDVKQQIYDIGDLLNERL